MPRGLTNIRVRTCTVSMCSYKLGTGVQNSDLMQQLMEIPTARKLHEDVIKVLLLLLSLRLCLLLRARQDMITCRNTSRGVPVFLVCCLQSYDRVDTLICCFFGYSIAQENDLAPPRADRSARDKQQQWGRGPWHRDVTLSCFVVNVNQMLLRCCSYLEPSHKGATSQC